MDFVKRPVAVFTLSFFISFCVLSNIENINKITVSIVASVLFACFTVSSFFFKKTCRILSVYALITVLAISLSSIYACHFTTKDDFSDLCLDEHECILYITDRNSTGEYFNTYTANVVSVDGEKSDFKTIVSSEEHFDIGNIVCADISFYLPGNDEVFDEAKYCLSMGVKIKGSLNDAKITGTDTKSLSVKIKHLNKKLSNILHKGFEGNTAEIADAVVLGNKSGLSTEIKRDFSRLGISHLLAISGMHISFICSGFSFLMKKAGIGRKIICAMTIFLMLFYMALTGFSPSVVRAAILCIMMSIIYIIGISYDGITCLGICGCIMLFFDPFCAYSVGMQLSFSSYIGCIVASRAQERMEFFDTTKKSNFLKRTLAKLVSSLVFTIFVVCFTLPVSWLYFGTTSVIAPLVNIVFIPAFSIVLYVSVVLLISYPIPFLFNLTAKVGTYFIGFLLSAASKISSLKGITVSTKYPFSPYIIVLLVIAIIAAAILKKKYAVSAWILTAALIVSYGIGIASYNASLANIVEVTRCADNSGEGLVIIADNRCILLELSEGSASNMKRALHYAEERRATDINTLVLSRLSEKTINGVKYLSEAAVLNTVYIPKPTYDTYSIYSEITNCLQEKGISCFDYSVYDEIFFFDNVSIKISDINSNTSKKIICTEICGKNENLIYLGKGWSTQRGKIINKYNLSSCNYLMFGSYGFDITTPYSGDYNGSVFMFVEENEDNKKYISSISETFRYSSSSNVTIKLK